MNDKLIAKVTSFLHTQGITPLRVLLLQDDKLAIASTGNLALKAMLRAYDLKKVGMEGKLIKTEERYETSFRIGQGRVCVRFGTGKYAAPGDKKARKHKDQRPVIILVDRALAKHDSVYIVPTEINS